MQILIQVAVGWGWGLRFLYCHHFPGDVHAVGSRTGCWEKLTLKMEHSLNPALLKEMEIMSHPGWVHGSSQPLFLSLLPCFLLLLSMNNKSMNIFVPIFVGITVCFFKNSFGYILRGKLQGHIVISCLIF